MELNNFVVEKMPSKFGQEIKKEFERLGLKFHK